MMQNRFKKSEINNRTTDLAFAGKLLSMLFAVMIMTAVLFMTAGYIFKSDAVLWIAQVLSAIIFVMMLYSPAWNQADRDRNAINFGKMKENKWRGLKCGLIAAIPYFLTGIFTIAVRAFNLDFNLVISAMIFNPFQFLFISLVPYTSVSVSSLPWVGVIFCSVFIPLAIPAVTTVAYMLGLREFSFYDVVVVKMKKKPETYKDKYGYRNKNYITDDDNK